ncbi:YbjN domain-containing protein, partial [Spirulina sp. 06S082]|uniref:YbjN domain-containing protein n=1 Tax=Spirulina sp. 06S082 TaxID=3110248 RepID=UPI002B208656
AIAIATPTVRVKKKGDSLVSCSLEFSTNLKIYQEIDRKALFNLNSDLRGKFLGQSFISNQKIKINLQLNPFLLAQLEPHAHNIRETAIYLETLGSQSTQNVLVSTESWFAISVQQQQKQTTTGYHTFWKFVQLGEATEDFRVEDFLNGMLDFLQETTDFDFAEMEEDIAEGLELYQKLSQIKASHPNRDLQPLIEQLTKNLRVETNLMEGKDLSQTLVNIENDNPLIDWSSLFKPTNQSQNSTSSPSEDLSIADDLQPLFEEFTDKLADPNKNQLLQIAESFFVREDWKIYYTDDSPSFHVQAKGIHGEWTCLVQINEPHEQFLFYSYCPLFIPEDCRPKVAEFLARANIEIVIGNFELNYDRGTIRYKTSIDVEGSHLAPSMVKQLVYTNIEMMDRYLPTLKQVIDQKIAPLEAIHQGTQN